MNDNTVTSQGTPADSTSILCEVCTQTDWSRRIRYPGYRAIFLLLLVVANSTWTSYKNKCEAIPFMSSPNRMTTDEWISLQQACLDAICDVSDRIQFDCKVDETGRSAYMLYLEEESAKVTFDPEIPIPNECIEATTQMAGPDELKKMQEVFRTGAVDFFHFSQNPEDMHMHDRKSIFQLLPGQCSVLEIFQQTWYQWYGNTHGSPPPPIPLINFRAVQPGQVVHVEASDFLCYKRGFAEQDRQLLSRWYETVLDNRWHLAFACMLVAIFVFESLATFSIMIELVPFTLCLVAISSDDDEGGNRIRTVLRQFWRIWKVLVGLCIVNMTVGETDQVYLICGLAAASMLFYNNSKAAMEWGFLHILAYMPHWESEAMVMTFLQVDDAIDMIFPVPMPGLIWKLVNAYIIYMIFPRLGKP